MQDFTVAIDDEVEEVFWQQLLELWDLRHERHELHDQLDLMRRTLSEKMIALNEERMRNRRLSKKLHELTHGDPHPPGLELLKQLG